MDGRADGAAAVPPAVVAPPMVSTADEQRPERAAAPAASPPVTAVLTTFEGQAVYKVLSPGIAFRAGDVFRFAYGSRSTRARLP